MPRKIYLLLVILIHSLFCLTAQDFYEVSDQVGIQGGFGLSHPFPVTFGAGLSFSDFDKDGWDDITIATDNDSTILFYRNIYGQFEKIDSLVPSTCLVKQILWVDLDNDGDKDLFHTCYKSQNKIYENTGNLVLIDKTSTSGLAMADDMSVSASFGDYDQDGDLDLFVGNYDNQGEMDFFYNNNGDFTFTDQSIAVGLHQTSIPTLASSFLDIDNDLKPDLYIAVDKIYENLLYLNNGTSYSDISNSSNANVIVCAMNSSSGDYDCDGDVDIYVTNTPSGNVLLRNNGDSTFTDVTLVAGVGFYRTGWASSFIDYDNDGDLDMYVSASELFEPNALYVNNGDGTFSEPLYINDGLGENDVGWSYCNTHGDFNHDGMVDLAVSNLSDDQFKLWQNLNENNNNWFKVDLEGVASNRDGIGSWVHVYAGNKKHIRFTHLGDGYLGQSSDFVHVGIGPEDQIDSLEVLWPSGIEDKYYDLEPNQLIKVVEGSSMSNPNPCPLIRYFKSDQPMDTTYYAQIAIISKGYITETDSSVLNSGLFHYLEPGFEITQGGELTIDFDDCTN